MNKKQKKALNALIEKLGRSDNVLADMLVRFLEMKNSPEISENFLMLLDDEAPSIFHQAVVAIKTTDSQKLMNERIAQLQYFCRYLKDSNLDLLIQLAVYCLKYIDPKFKTENVSDVIRFANPACISENAREPWTEKMLMTIAKTRSDERWDTDQSAATDKFLFSDMLAKVARMITDSNQLTMSGFVGSYQQYRQPPQKSYLYDLADHEWMYLKFCAVVLEHALWLKYGNNNPIFLCPDHEKYAAVRKKVEKLNPLYLTAVDNIQEQILFCNITMKQRLMVEFANFPVMDRLRQYLYYYETDFGKQIVYNKAWFQEMNGIVELSLA